jgi:hypothetical protein
VLVLISASSWKNRCEWIADYLLQAIYSNRRGTAGPCRRWHPPNGTLLPVRRGRQSRDNSRELGCFPQCCPHAWRRLGAQPQVRGHALDHRRLFYRRRNARIMWSTSVAFGVVLLAVNALIPYVAN